MADLASRLADLEARIAELEATDRGLRERLAKLAVKFQDLRDAIREQNRTIASLNSAISRALEFDQKQIAKGSNRPILSLGPPAPAVRVVRTWLAFGLVALATGGVLGLGRCAGLDLAPTAPQVP